MDDSKALILVKSYLKDVHYKEPERAQNLNNRTVKAIKNAFDKAILDKRGWIWIEEESIHSLLRVKTKADARYYRLEYEKNESSETQSSTDRCSLYGGRSITSVSLDHIFKYKGIYVC